MNQQVTPPKAPLPAPIRSVLYDMAERYGMEAQAFEATVRAVCLPPDKTGRVATREEFAAFLLVAKEYGLNPLTREIYGFRAKNGNIIPIVGVDGWMTIMNQRPELDGVDTEDLMDEEGNLIAVTARVWRKDRSRPIVVTEYLQECLRDTEPWRQWPRRMLRHKSVIQAARYAFGFSGISDPDDAERMIDITPQKPSITPPPAPRGGGGRGAPKNRQPDFGGQSEPETVQDPPAAVAPAAEQGKGEAAGQPAPAASPAPPPAPKRQKTPDPVPPTTAVGEAGGGQAAPESEAVDGGNNASPKPSAASANLSVDDVQRLRAYSVALMNERSSNGLQKASMTFWDGEVPDEETMIGRKVSAIYEAHSERCKGKSSPTEVDQAVGRILA